MEINKVLLASPRGFCAGVEMAIKALAALVKAFDEPVYCYHEIVHNKQIVERFEKHGVVFVSDIDEVPEGAPLMLSAHGSAPEVQQKAAKVSKYLVDSVCPLVTKVHHEVKVRTNKGYHIIYVGHDGHEEAVGTIAVAPQAIHRVEKIEDVKNLPDFEEDVALLAQTTLSHSDWKEVADTAKEKYPKMWMPGRSDLCFATTNRQDALKKIVGKCDVMVVVGSSNSSNTLALEKISKEMGCPEVYRINHASELPNTLFGVVGVTAGASAPEELVKEVLDTLNPKNGIEEVSVTNEDEYFPPPRQLRTLISSVCGFAAAGLGGKVPNAMNSDREINASQVLGSMEAVWA